MNLKNKLSETLSNEEVQFIAIANTYLKDLILSNEHPFVKGLPEKHKGAFLMSKDGMGVNIDRSLILDYVKGNLEPRQKFILDLCEIRVVGDWTKVKSSE